MPPGRSRGGAGLRKGSWDASGGRPGQGRCPACADCRLGWRQCVRLKSSEALEPTGEHGQRPIAVGVNRLTTGGELARSRARHARDLSVATAWPRHGRDPIIIGCVTFLDDKRCRRWAAPSSSRGAIRDPGSRSVQWSPSPDHGWLARKFPLDTRGVPTLEVSNSEQELCRGMRPGVHVQGLGLPTAEAEAVWLMVVALPGTRAAADCT